MSVNMFKFDIIFTCNTKLWVQIVIQLSKCLPLIFNFLNFSTKGTVFMMQTIGSVQTSFRRIARRLLSFQLGISGLLYWISSWNNHCDVGIDDSVYSLGSKMGNFSFRSFVVYCNDRILCSIIDRYLLGRSCKNKKLKTYHSTKSCCNSRSKCSLISIS